MTGKAPAGRLFTLLLSVAASTFAGTAVVVALVAGYAQIGALLISAVIGAALAVPLTWLVVRAMTAGR